MSKEAAAGDTCACGQRIAFPAQHWPHCPANPKNMDKATLAAVSDKFTPRELAIIQSHGPAVEVLQSKGGKRRG